MFFFALFSLSLIYGESTANVTFIQRTYEIFSPATSTPVGTVHDLVPGSKIVFSIGLKNQSTTTTASAYSVRDIVPVNTHLYFQVPPTMNGNALNVEYQGVTTNSGSGNEVKFTFDLPPNEHTTFSYTVTVD